MLIIYNLSPPPPTKKYTQIKTSAPTRDGIKTNEKCRRQWTSPHSLSLARGVN